MKLDFDDWDSLMAYSRDLFARSGDLPRYRRAEAMREGPRYLLMQALESMAQLCQEDAEARLSPEGRIYFDVWLKAETELQELRLCESFMRGGWYERTYRKETC